MAGEQESIAQDQDAFEAAFSGGENAGNEGGGQARDERGRFASADGGSEVMEEVAEIRDRNGLDDGKEEREHRIPLSEHLSEREKRQAAERRAEQFERELAEFRRRAAEAERKPREVPDLITEPEAYRDYVREEAAAAVAAIEARMISARVDDTFAEQDEKDPETFKAAFAALQSAGQSVIRQIRTAPNPGRALMRWHRTNETLRVTGGDIGSYEKQLRDKLKKDPEFRKEFMADLDAEARGGSDRPSNVTDLPSLNRAPGGAGNQRPGSLGNSDEERFANAFSRRR